MPDIGDGSELEETKPDNIIYLTVEILSNITPRCLRLKLSFCLCQSAV